jgi:hypothetical protein
MNTLNRIIQLLKDQPNSRPGTIAESIGVSRQYIQRVLSDNNELFIVAGTGPNRFYRLANGKSQSTDIQSDIPESIILEQHFYSLDPLGNEMIGSAGFRKWCSDRGFDYASKAKEYSGVINKYYGKNKKKIYDFTSKMEATFANDLQVSKIWASDFYSFEIFGKTKLGTKVLIAKQSSDPATIKELVAVLYESIKYIMKTTPIDALAFVSPTIQRQNQLMTSLDQQLKIDLPRLKVMKVGARILIPQKTLKSLKDRILNAEQTFAVESDGSYKNVLIIDDALGSGATINEIARQIKQKGYAKKCYGLALVASPSGYEVVNEV